MLCPGTCNDYGGRDHAPDVAPSATAGVEPVWRLRAIAKQSVCYCLEALGRHDDALHEAKAAAEMSILARSGGGGVLRAPAHVNETFVDVRLPSTTGALFMYKEAIRRLYKEAIRHVHEILLQAKHGSKQPASAAPAPPPPAAPPPPPPPHGLYNEEDDGRDRQQ